MRFHLSTPGVMCALAFAVWASPAHAEHSAASFPDSSDDQPAQQAQPRPLSPSLPQPPPPSQPAVVPTQRSVTIAPIVTPEHDVDARETERRRKAWMLSLEGVTHAPIDMGVQLGLETPQGLRLFGGYGWVPGSYMSLLTGLAGNASGNSYAQAVLEQAKYQGHTWRVQLGLRPFHAIGLYADVGYARLNAKGSLDLTATGVPMLEALGGGYEASTRLDMWLVELGYQGEIADRVVLALALGAMGTLSSKTSITSVNGAPTSNAIFSSVANQADTAFEKYGVVPTLTLRLGFDLI